MREVYATGTVRRVLRLMIYVMVAAEADVGMRAE